LKNVVAIDLSQTGYCHELGDDKVTALMCAATCTQSCRNLTSLKLRGSEHKAIGAQALAAALPAFPSLRELDLACHGDAFGDTVECNALTITLSALTNLTRLDLRGRPQSKDFAHVLPLLKQLVWLGMAAMNAQAAFVAHPTLQSLTFQDNVDSRCVVLQLLVCKHKTGQHTCYNDECPPIRTTPTPCCCCPDLSQHALLSMCFCCIE
jgi:hypothetical protein